MSTIIDKANALLTDNGERLKKSEEVIAQLNSGKKSVYNSEAGAIIERDNNNISLAQALKMLDNPDSGDSGNNITDPIVDRIKVQLGFNGSTGECFIEGVAPTKALATAEGAITSGVMVHTGVKVEITKTSGVGGDQLDDAMVARNSTDVFAKREQNGGWDPDKKIVTRTENASGLRQACPYDPFNTWEPEKGNLLAQIASGISYEVASNYFEKIKAESEELRTAVLTVCTRNKNGPQLDQIASDYFSSKMNLVLGKKKDNMIHGTLMRLFRGRRGSIGVNANNATCSTITIGMPQSRHSINESVVWTNSQKLGHIKTITTDNGTVYLASSYDQRQLFTVPWDIDLVDEKVLKDIAAWEQMALRYGVNQSRQILGYAPVALDEKIMEELSRYSGTDRPTVWEALGLNMGINKAVKNNLVKLALDTAADVLTDFKDSVLTKAAENFGEDDYI